MSSPPHWLRALAGGVDDPATLVGAAEAFLVSGGRTTPADHMQLDAAERAALWAAGRRVRAASACAVGRAARSAQGEAEVWAEVDGGEALHTLEEDEVFAAVRQALDARPAGGEG